MTDKWYKDLIYIKMCQQAEEIQKLFREQVGDYLYMPKDGECAIVAENYREYRVLVSVVTEKSFAFDDPFIWLPRQDQLQEMVGLNQHNVSTIFPVLTEFHFRNMYEAIEDEHLTIDKGTRLTDWHQRQFKSVRHFRHTFTSMEQLWLAFVMKEKYGKVWSEAGWEYCEN